MAVFQQMNPGTQPRERSVPASTPVLLYDGECGLCNAVVHWLLRKDEAGRLCFAALQSPFGQETLRRLGLPTEDFDSLVFLPDRHGSAYAMRTDGVLAAVALLGGKWRAVSRLRILPRGLRDAGYKVVARFRYRLFGRYVPSPLPVAAWAERFVDQEPGSG